MSTDPLASLKSAEYDQTRVEKFLTEAIRVEGDDYLTEITSHLITAGGKRQRPRFTIAAAAAGSNSDNPVSDDVVRGGVAVELVQVGSLYHDDVLDEAELRRQVDSVNARWGNLRAILAGDYLLAKASEIAAELGTEVAGLLARTIADLCQGQVSELQTSYDHNRTEAQYYKSIEGKTASLFAASTRIGGIVAEHAEDTTQQLSDFGHLYGLAFQIVDDILDVTATSEQLGKPAGQDIVEGVYSLPVIFALQSNHGNQLRELLVEGIPENDQLKALDLIRSSEAIPQAISEAEKYIKAAQEKIFEVSHNEASEALANTAQKLLDSLEPATKA